MHPSPANANLRNFSLDQVSATFSMLALFYIQSLQVQDLQPCRLHGICRPGKVKSPLKTLPPNPFFLPVFLLPLSPAYCFVRLEVAGPLFPN